MVELDIINIYVPPRKVSIFLLNKTFHFLLNNCNDLISFKLFGKLFHMVAPLYFSELLGMIRFFFT